MKIYVVMRAEAFFQDGHAFLEKLFLNETDALNFITDSEYGADCYIIEAMAH